MLFFLSKNENYKKNAVVEEANMHHKCSKEGTKASSITDVKSLTFYIEINFSQNPQGFATNFYKFPALKTFLSW